MGWHGFGMGWLMWLLMALGIAGFWVLVVVVVRAVLRDRGPAGTTGAAALAPEAPLTVLDRRLASGEIDIEEYHRIRRTLTGGP